MGLDTRRQGISWDDSETKKKQKASDSKKGADRYFSVVNRRLLRSDTPLTVLSKYPDAITSSSYLRLSDGEEENERRKTGTEPLHSKQDTVAQGRDLASHVCFYLFIVMLATSDLFHMAADDRTQASAANPLGVYDSSTALWLQGKGQPEQQKPDIHTEDSVTPLTGRTEEFNRRLREHPTDTQLWIQFIQYQVW